MRINCKRISLAAVAALGLAGVVAAQVGPGRRNAGDGPKRLETLASRLNLTASQQERAKALFAASRDEARPLMQQVRQGRAALRDAARAGKSEGELKQLADQQGDLLGQLAAIRARTQAQFHAMLTPEQQQKAAELGRDARERMSRRWRDRSKN